MDNYAYEAEEHNKSHRKNPYTISKTACGIDRNSTGYPVSVNNGSANNADYLVEVNTKSKVFRRPKFYRIVTFILLFVLVLVLILLIVVIYLYCRAHGAQRLCTSEQCLRSAANLRLSVATSVDPCDDFYAYTCGRWSAEHPNHGWFPSFSAFATISERVMLQAEALLRAEEEDELQEPRALGQARAFHRSCMDDGARAALGLGPLWRYLEMAELPQLPRMLRAHQDNSSTFHFDYLRSDAVLKKVFAMDVLIGFTVDANVYNRSQNVMYLGSPAKSCPLPSPLRRPTGLRTGEERHQPSARSDDVEELLRRKETNENIVRLVVGALVKNATGEQPQEEVMEEAVRVLLNVTAIVDELVENYTETDAYGEPEHIIPYQTAVNKGLMSKINQDYPGFIEKYIGYLFENTNITIDFETDEIHMGQIDRRYLELIMETLITTPEMHLELYMWWVAVYAMIMNTTPEMEDQISQQTAPFYANDEVALTHSMACGMVVTDFMGMAVSYGIADRSFANSTRPKVENMLEDIKYSFIQQIRRVNWMDRETKTATLEKSEEMISFIGYPDWLFTDGALDKYYDEVEVNEDAFLDNMMEFVRRYIPKKLDSLRSYNHRNWSTDPTTVNAFNSFQDNAIHIPLAILSFPMYNLGLEALNYGAMGSVLGHEFSHGFDNTGRKHDKYGNYKQWWPNGTIEEFETRIECFVHQYDNLTVQGKHVDGQKTLGENLADNEGLTLAYRAYKNWARRNVLGEARLPGFENFTHDQLFFVAFGSIWCETIGETALETELQYDEHSPNSARVIGTLQNSEDFSKAFRCPIGSNMNPKRTKCKEW